MNLIKLFNYLLLLFLFILMKRLINILNRWSQRGKYSTLSLILIIIVNFGSKTARSKMNRSLFQKGVEKLHLFDKIDYIDISK